MCTLHPGYTPGVPAVYTGGTNRTPCVHPAYTPSGGGSDVVGGVAVGELVDGGTVAAARAARLRRVVKGSAGSGGGAVKSRQGPRNVPLRRSGGADRCDSNRWLRMPM